MTICQAWAQAAKKIRDFFAAEFPRRDHKSQRLSAADVGFRLIPFGMKLFPFAQECTRCRSYDCQLQRVWLGGCWEVFLTTCGESSGIGSRTN